MPIPAGNSFPALPVVRAELAGTLSAPAAVASLRSINGNLVACGARLEVVNGSNQDVGVTVIDPGRTPAGNPGEQDPVEVPEGAATWFELAPEQVDPATNTITVAIDPAVGVAAQVVY